MKKLLAFAICILMCVSLFSCDKKNSQSEDLPSETTAVNKGGAFQSNNGNKSSSNSKPVTKDSVLKAYEEVLNNERTLKYPIYNSQDFNDIYLKGISGFSQYDNATQAVIDMDKDGTDEMIVANNSRKVLLHYENDAVYGYDFYVDAMQIVYTDGSFSWHHYGLDLNESGVSRISFVNGKLKFQELYRTESYKKFYVDGIEVTSDEYYDYIENNPKTAVEFAPIDIASLNEGKAIEIASKYWNIENGSFDTKTGYRYRYDAYQEGEVYHVCLYWFVNNSHYENLKCVSVNVYTGEISASSAIHAKG